MRVVELEARHVRIPLKRKITHASHVRTETDNVVVRCVLSDGIGRLRRGRAARLRHRRNHRLVLDLLKRSDLGKQLGSDCPDFVAAVHLAERIRLAPVPGDDRMIQGNAARCAVELAVLDAFGRAFGEPLTRVTELVAAGPVQVPRGRAVQRGHHASREGVKKRSCPLRCLPARSGFGK